MRSFIDFRQPPALEIVQLLGLPRFNSQDQVTSPSGHWSLHISSHLLGRGSGRERVSKSLTHIATALPSPAAETATSPNGETL